MINFQNVSKSYNSHNALTDINLQIEPHEFVSLVGKSGAGKSTIVKLVIGEEKPTKGRVFFGQYEVNKLRPEEMYQLRRHIGIVFQDFKLLPKKTAFENVAFALEAAGRPQNEIEDVTREVLDLVDLSDKIKNFPHELSGGEKQRVGIARAMVNKPDVLIADEPTGNLDPINSQSVVELLTRINELGTTVILATHNKDIINELGKRVVSLDDGRIVRDNKKGKYILA